MNLLLDTHAYLWALLDAPDLSPTVRKQILSGRGRVYVSVASSWEIAIKFGIGKLALDQEKVSDTFLGIRGLLPWHTRHAS